MPARKQPVQYVDQDEDAAQSVQRRQTSVTVSSSSPAREPESVVLGRRPPTRQQSQQLQQLQQEVDDEDDEQSATRQTTALDSSNPRAHPFRGWARYYSNPHPLTLLRGFRNVTSLVGFLFFVRLFLHPDSTSTGVSYNVGPTSTTAAFTHTAHEVPYTTLTATSLDAMLSINTKINTSADNTSAAFDVARAAACANLVKIWHPVEISTHVQCQAICEDVQSGR